MRPILLSGHERALTQVKYVGLPSSSTSAASADMIPLDSPRKATSSSPLAKTTFPPPGTVPTASASAPTKATSVPFGQST